MATLAISKDFLSDYAKLHKTIQAKVTDLAGKFQQMTAQQLRESKGIHLEKHKEQRDSRARTIRIDDNHRGVVLDAGNDQLYVLCAVDTHDKVEHWMGNNEFRVNEATGALEIIDPALLDAALAELPKQVAAVASGGLYDHRSDKEFKQLGIDTDLVPTVRAFSDEDQLEGLLVHLPQGQAEALVLLLGDESADVIYGQIAPETNPGQIDTGDLAAAVEKPASRAQFHVLAEQDELQEMLAQPLAQWRTYLHPSQQQAAYRPEYSGPARITGGAGTGKTVVAMHRAKFLAERLPAGTRSKQILFTTFTKNLADAIERDLRSLGGTDLLDAVEVINVDRLAYRIVSGAESSSPTVAQNTEVDEIWKDVVDELALEYTPAFLAAEFDQVVLAQALNSRAEYFSASRAGRGVRLSRRNRAEVWKAIEGFTQELARRGKRTYLQLASDAAGYLKTRTVKPYRHVIVDEAQDLHETQWRLLRAAVGEQPNDMFIVGDSHQRIYDRQTSLSKVGIKVVGRSRRLRINYRTTHEILRWSLAFLGEGTFDDLDEGVETQALSEYHSYLHGDPPAMAGFDAKQHQLQGLLNQVRLWIDGGVVPEDIAVASRTGDGLDSVENTFGKADIASVRLDDSVPTGVGVRLGTMHRLKGVEYRCVALVDMDDHTMPLTWALTSKVEDEMQHEADLRRERCTAYVAATRAREFLWVGWSGRPSPFLIPLLDFER